MSAYAKAAAAVIAAVLSGLVAALVDQQVSTVEWVNVAIAGAGAAAVFTAPNVPGARYTKFWLAVLTAVLTLAVSLIIDGMSTSDWLQLAVAGLGAATVGAVPNKQGPVVRQ